MDDDLIIMWEEMKMVTIPFNNGCATLIPQ